MSPPSDPPQKYVVPEGLGGARLDRVLAELVKGFSRTRLQALVKEGRVRVDGEPAARPNAAVAQGAELELDLPLRAKARDPGVRALPVLFEDETVLVVDKPAGLLTHRARPDQETSVADLANERYGPLPEVQGADRPGIVHRLDRGTSGVLVLGRTQAALEALKEQFKARTVEKLYLALVHGTPRFHSDWIETPIAAVPRQPDRFEVVREELEEPGMFGEGDKRKVRAASTYFETRERFPGFTFVECRPKTGRTHQIRVHLNSIDLPIVGDPLYRRQGRRGALLPEGAPALHRQALHASTLAFDHPATGERLTFEAPLAPDFAAVVEWLRAERPEEA